jgi:serine/threonine-protein kinase RsbW
MSTGTLQRHSISIEGGVASAKASAWARALAEKACLSADRIYAIDLCVVEMVTNVVDHAYGERPGVIRLELELGSDSAVLTIIDDGPPFDPLAAPAPNKPGSLDEAGVGGYGIHMVRATADACRYERRNGQNVFTAYFGAAPPGEGGARANAGPLGS